MYKSNGPSKPDRESAARETMPKSKYQENENTGHIPLGESIVVIQSVLICVPLAGGINSAEREVTNDVRY